MLRRKQDLQLDAGGIEQDVDRGAELAVDAAGIGKQAYLLALQAFETGLLEHFDAGEHFGGGRDGLGGACLGSVGGLSRLPLRPLPAGAQRRQQRHPDQEQSFHYGISIFLRAMTAARQVPRQETITRVKKPT